jgi:uncharacterized protein YjbI with pentapeptide repeats
MTIRPPLAAAFACVALLSSGLAVSASEADEQKLKATRSCAGCDLTYADLTGAQIGGADLRGANLSGATLYGSNLQNANLTDAALNGANLRNANLRGALGANVSVAQTDERTTCPNGQSGPCH